MSNPNTQTLNLDCKERVAFDMMKMIGEADTQHLPEKLGNPKKYAFELYLECLTVVSGRRPDCLE